MLERPLLMLIAALAPFASVSAAAARELCADRPGKDTPPCIAEAGHVVVEVGGIHMSYQNRAGEKTRVTSVGETLVRIGVSESSEIQMELAPYNVMRTFVKETGQRRVSKGASDLTVAFKQNFMNPDGQGTSAAAQLFIQAPTGAGDISDKAWEGGIIIPVSFELSDTWSLTIDPELDWRGNEDGHGHHFAWVGVMSLSHELGSGVEGSAELWASRDRDPADHTTQANADIALAWVPHANENLQLDAELDLGLTQAAPDLEAAIGVSYRF